MGGEMEWIFDLEADGLLDTATQVWCGVFRNVDTGEVRKFYNEDPYYLHHMLKFMDTCETLIGHNVLGYDFPLLEKLYGYKYKGNKIDTLVLSKLLNPKRPVPWSCPVKNRPHSVETWGYRVGRGKPEHNDWTQFSPEMLHRCTEDTEIQTLIYSALQEEMQEGDWKFASWLTNRLFDILGKQEAYGWKVDKEWMEYIIHMTTRWIDRIDRALKPHLPMVMEIQESKVKGEYKYVKTPFVKSGAYHSNTAKWLDAIGWDKTQKPVGGPYSRVLFRPLDPSSRTEAIDYLLESGWEPKEWNTDKETGERTSPKLSKDDPFEGVEGREGKLLAKRVQIRHRRSSVEGLLKLVRPDGRIASRVSNLAETGRATHSGIVNIPNTNSFLGKWMRRIFISDDDKVLVSVDSDGCQNRMLAARVGDPAFTHTMLHGKKEDKTTLHYVNLHNLHEAGYPVHYNMAKNINYAFMFGGSDNKLGKMVGGTKEDGAEVRKAMLKVSAGFANLVESLQAEWRKTAKKRPNKWGSVEYYDGWIRGLDGRPIKIDSEHKLLVYMLQSDEAIMMSLAYVFLYDWLEAEGYQWGEDWAYVCFYHDEYTIECKPELAERIKYLGEQAIVKAGEYLHIQCPHLGDGSIGKNWCEVH
jgi:DNA polymerase I-like protein with 3'-5' exonuclease and polymerase domains